MLLLKVLNNLKNLNYKIISSSKKISFLKIKSLTWKKIVATLEKFRKLIMIKSNMISFNELILKWRILTDIYIYMDLLISF
jgi:hypothetical protein